MLLIIFSVISLIAFIVLFKIKHQQKINILVWMVIVMVAANYLNQLNNSLRYVDRFDAKQSPRRISFEKSLYQSTNDRHELLTEQQKVLEYLVQHKNKNENIMVYFENLNFERFRVIFGKFQAQNNNIIASEINGNDPSELDLYSMKTLVNSNSDSYYCLIVQNFNTFNKLNLLKNIYLRNKISIIFKNIPKNFTYHSINDFTQIVTLNENYFFPQLSKTFTSQIISKCNKFIDINYDFYLKSQNTPLIDLCCLDLPRTTTTQCIKSHLSESNEFIPYGQVEHCLKDKNQQQQGVIYRNGMVKLQKGYFWSGKCDKKEFQKSQSHEL